jgi:hypothetical protein
VNARQGQPKSPAIAGAITADLASDR